MAAKQDLVIEQGKTFQRVVRWETLPFVYKAISAITNAGPVSITTIPDHGVVDGWSVAIVSAGGMDEINAGSDTPKSRDFHKATVTGAKTLELNTVNSAEYGVYTSGGYVQYYTPVSLGGFTANMQIRTKAGGTVLASTAAADAPLNIIVVAVDDATKTVSLTISATSTAALTWKKGTYDLEMVSGTGVVTTLMYGAVAVNPEVTVT
jgi:hypothetical protein